MFTLKICLFYIKVAPKHRNFSSHFKLNNSCYFLINSHYVKLTQYNFSGSFLGYIMYVLNLQIVLLCMMETVRPLDIQIAVVSVNFYDRLIQNLVLSRT